MSEDKLADAYDPALTPPETSQEAYSMLDDLSISDEQISEMKVLGLHKPLSVSWGRWMGPKDIKQRHEFIIHLAALGRTNRQIARELGMTDSRLTIIMQTPIIKKAIKDKITEYFGNDARQYIKSLATKGFEVLDEVLTNPIHKTNDKLRAAEYVLDQTVGRANQTVEVKGSLLSELMIKLEREPVEKDATNSVPAEVAEATIPKLVAAPKDDVDNFVDTLEILDSVVGKREPENA